MRISVLLAVAMAALGAVPAALAVPRIVLQPTTSSPGRLVTVSGRGFCTAADCSGITIQIYGAPVARGVPVSAAGRFVRRVRVPGGPEAGDVGVTAIQHLANGRDATAIAFLTIVLRTLPPTTNPGTTVTVTTRTEPPPPTTTAEAPTTATTPPVTRPPTNTPPSPAPATTSAGPATTGTTTTATATTASTAAAAGASSEDDGNGPWPWLAVLAGVGLLVAAAGWAFSRARPRR
jgi:hypothetical protein